MRIGEEPLTKIEKVITLIYNLVKITFDQALGKVGMSEPSRHEEMISSLTNIYMNTRKNDLNIIIKEIDDYKGDFSEILEEKQHLGSFVLKGIEKVIEEHFPRIWNEQIDILEYYLITKDPTDRFMKAAYNKDLIPIALEEEYEHDVIIEFKPDFGCYIIRMKRHETGREVSLGYFIVDDISKIKEFKRRKTPLPFAMDPKTFLRHIQQGNVVSSEKAMKE